jgi:hypothetical protein
VKRRTAYILAGATLVAAAFVLSGVRVLMILGGLPLCLILPGLALSAALFRRPGRLVPIERIMLVPALSLGTLILSGLLAWLVRAPLHRATWLTLTAAVTLIALTADQFRTPASPGETSFSVRVNSRRLLTQILPAVVAVLLLAGATWLSLVTSIRTHKVAVTTLSVIPPGTADASGNRSIEVNATGLSSGTYTLKVTSTTSNISTPVTADENGLWTSTLHLPADERLTLALYQAGQSLPMRTVIIASAATG